MAWEMGGPPRLGPGYLLGVGAGRGQRLVPLHAIPSPVVWWGPGNWSPWELRRCDPLRGIGLMGYVAKCKRGGVVLCHVFKYRKGPAPIWKPPGPTHAGPRPAPSGSYSVLSGPPRSAPRSLSDPCFITWGQYTKSGPLPQQTLRGTAPDPAGAPCPAAGPFHLTAALRPGVPAAPGSPASCRPSDTCCGGAPGNSSCETRRPSQPAPEGLPAPGPPPPETGAAV